MRGVDNPNVVKLISFSESDEHYFLVLERMRFMSPFACSALTHVTVLGGGELFHQMCGHRATS